MRDPTITPAYAALYPVMAEAARSCGYALSLHGTMSRDLDVLACPWTEEATDAETVMRAVCQSIGAYLVEQTSNLSGTIRRNGRDPERKPHGRLAYSLHLEGGAVVDLSIMPRIAENGWDGGPD